MGGGGRGWGCGGGRGEGVGARYGVRYGVGFGVGCSGVGAVALGGGGLKFLESALFSG